MTHNLAPDTGDSIALQLDGLGRNYRLLNALESVTVGGLLLQLKTVTRHGDFLARVKSLGLEKTAVTRYMACARSFDPARDSALLTAAKSRSKLFELLVLEPVEIEALRLGKEVRGLTLERLESMTVLELRGALRQWREEDAQAVDQAISKKLPTFIPRTELAPAITSSTPLPVRALNQNLEDAVEVLSHFDAAQALAQLGMSMSPELVATLRTSYPAGVPEDKLEALLRGEEAQVVAQPLKASEEPVQPSESSSTALDTGESIFSQLNEHGRIFSLGNAIEGLTAGNLLLQAEAAVPKGTFKKRAKLLGFDDSAAAAYMACARIFDLEIDAPLVVAAKSISKLRELLILDAEEVEALNQGEEVRGLTLERIALMTVQQLRDALGKEASPAVKRTREEETLLRNYRKCGPQARAHVAQAAELLAGR